MTIEETEAQRRSRAISEMLAAHPDMTRPMVEAIYERVAGRVASTNRAAGAAGPIMARIRRKPEDQRLPAGDIASRLSLTLAALGIALGLAVTVRLIGALT